MPTQSPQGITRVSLHWPLIRRCLTSPTRQLMVDDRKGYKGIELLVGAAHLADAIAARSRTQTVGLLLPTSGAFPICALGAWMLGKTIVPLNYLLKPDELQYVVDDCGTDTILTVEPMLEHLGTPPRVKSLVTLESLSFKGIPEPRWPARIDDDELAALLYTSGTSGKPKGVMLTHANLFANLRQVQRWVQFDRSDIVLGVLPQFHSFGLTVLTLMPLLAGLKTVYSARFVPTKIVQLFRTHRPTMFIGIPSMYGALLSVKNAGPEDFASLRYAVSGAEPLPASIRERFLDRFGVHIDEGYGLTETSPVTNWCRPSERKVGSVGKPLPDIDQRIVDMNNGRMLPQGEEGEIIIKGPNVMRGYYHLPEETAQVFDDQGYFRTGDIGRFDEEGRLSITGRLKEMLIVGGENVFPREIEEVLIAHPTVEDAGVVGEPDDIRGEQPVAFVQAAEGQTPDEAALRDWCRERLAGYKVPRRIIVLDEMPRNPTGKIMRRELSSMLAAST